MKAAVVRSFGGPDSIKILTNLEIPKIEKTGQVLIKVFRSGVNPVDTYIRSGKYSALPSLPYTPGRDGAGIVENAAEDVKHVKKGDRVWFFSDTNGSAAEFAVATKVFLLPDEITFSMGASLGIPYLTAYRALFIKSSLPPDAKVLVHGASGGVGLAACQLGAWKSVEIVGTAGTAEGCENVKKNGAASVYNHREPDYVEKMKKNHPQGFDLILEMAAHVNLATDLSLVSKRGRVAVIGSRSPIEIDPRLLMSMESSIFGVSLVHTTTAEYELMSNEICKMLTTTEYRPVVQREYPFEELPQAHADIINSKGALGNLIVKTD